VPARDQHSFASPQLIEILGNINASSGPVHEELYVWRALLAAIAVCGVLLTASCGTAAQEPPAKFSSVTIEVSRE
jgi:hypothetical protein